MNFIINIINKIIIIINRFIDNLDKKTVAMIKNSFYGFIFALIITGIFIGYNSGKSAAKKYGKSLTESTNNLFDTSIKRDRDKDQSRSMLETELIEEKKDTDLKKIAFPAREGINPELENNLIEPADIKKTPSLHLDSQKIADVDRTDEKYKKPDVRELKKEFPKIKDKGSKENNPIDTQSKIIEK